VVAGGGVGDELTAVEGTTAGATVAGVTGTAVVGTAVTGALVEELAVTTPICEEPPPGQKPTIKPTAAATAAAARANGQRPRNRGGGPPAG
jgi:hypothetical protein